MSRWSTKNAKSTLKYLITPLLFSVYPLIFLYTYNAETLNLVQLAAPLLFAILLATLIYLFCKLVLKQNIIASLAAVGFLILFWNYELFFTGITNFSNLNYWHILPLLLFIYGHLVWLICFLYKRFDLEKLHQILFAVVSILIIFNLFTMISVEARKHLISQKIVQQKINVNKADTIQYPDIYVILLDEYARFDTIEEEWGYDNSPFLDFLTNKGFFIAEKSESRFTSTAQAVPSIMDLNYIDDNLSVSKAMNKINNSYLLSYFDNLGFQVVYLDGFGRPEHKLNNKNIIHKYIMDLDIKENFSLDEFTRLAAMKTLLNPIISIIDIGSSNMWYQATKYYFNYLADYPSTANKKDQPSFLFAHIQSPHLPYVFDRNGNFLENPTNYWEYKSLDKKVLKSLYLEQYIFTTLRTIDILNEIFKKSKKEPIILLMSDHGPRSNAGIDNIIQHHRVLNAVYFPNGNYADLYESIATVNTLRVILNKYFGEKLAMLEDR